MGGRLVRGELCARRRAESERAGEWQRKGNKRRGLGRSTGQSEVNAAHVRKPNYSLGRRWVPMRHGLTAIASLNAMRCLANISVREQWKNKAATSRPHTAAACFEIFNAVGYERRFRRRRSQALLETRRARKWSGVFPVWSSLSNGPQPSRPS